MSRINLARRASGFSLIELMVVAFIIALGFVLAPNIGTGGSAYSLRIEAKTFANYAAIAAEEAVLTGDQWGIDVYRDSSSGRERYGYRWLRQHNGVWRVEIPLGMETEVEYIMAHGTQLELAIDGINVGIDMKPILDREKSLSPDIWLLSNSQVTPFILTLINDAGMKIRVGSDALGRMKIHDDE